MEQQIIRTMMTETVDSNVRLACAKILMRHENGFIRSVAFWYTRSGHMSASTKMWWAKFNTEPVKVISITIVDLTPCEKLTDADLWEGAL